MFEVSVLTKVFEREHKQMSMYVDQLFYVKYMFRAAESFSTQLVLLTSIEISKKVLDAKQCSGIILLLFQIPLKIHKDILITKLNVHGSKFL